MSYLTTVLKAKVRKCETVGRFWGIQGVAEGAKVRKCEAVGRFWGQHMLYEQHMLFEQHMQINLATPQLIQ